MNFISIEFAFFLPIVFLLYWAIGYAKISNSLSLKLQNILIVIASYVFYGWWDWRFLLLIFLTSICSWGSGLLIDIRNDEQQYRSAKVWLIANVVFNIGVLSLFKYYNFFVIEFGQLLGVSTENVLLKIVLPVGISFYTFQALSYSIDVYRKKIKPTSDIVAFFAYISFFPQLVAGPIERATNLLPQFQNNRRFNHCQASDGMRQILWGLFKKIVIADNCATYVDNVWMTFDTQNGSTLLLSAFLFTFQIYCDFSGYSDMAIGIAKLFGFKLMQNFNNPYFSRDIAEFWRRWHMSLTTWFRDYVYIPLGGSRPYVPAKISNPERYKKIIVVRNTFVIFLLSGLWHGANWTFVVWGAYHAILFLPLILLGKNRKHMNNIAENQLLPTWREFIQIIITFGFAVVGWIIFRAPDIHSFFIYMITVFDMSTFSIPQAGSTDQISTICMIMVLLMIEWGQRKKQHGLQFKIKQWYIRYTIYFVFIFSIVYFYNDVVTFIYFQF